MARVERSYTIKRKREALALADEIGTAQAARRLHIAHRTVHGWTKQADAIWNFQGQATSKSLKGQGRREAFPNVSDLVTYMKDTRRAEAVLSTVAMIQVMWKIEPEWMASYVEGKKKPEGTLERMVQRMAKRHGFSSQKPQEVQRSFEDLEEVRAKFSLEFWAKYSEYQGGGILNVDETAILFDMPPIKSWALKGRQDSARVLRISKHAGRMTAVLTIRDDGMKLPILFIIRGVPGGRIEQNEFEEYPEEHFYAVQDIAWMDKEVWKIYVEKLLKYEIDRPAVLLLDNFDFHVSDEGQRVVAEVANATVVPLPPNSTAVCQPLDVGVMGLLKAKLRHSARSTGGTGKEKRLRAIHATIAAWNAIKPRTVIRSFEKAIPRHPEVSV